MVTGIVPPTTLVAIENVALVVPTGTVTDAGTVTGSPPDSETTAPPGGALPVSVAVPVTDAPPTTVGALSEIDWSADPLVTVSTGDCPVPPFIDAAIVAVPGETPVTTKVALDTPA